jgi:hypothetical protein
LSGGHDVPILCCFPGFDGDGQGGIVDLEAVDDRLEATSATYLEVASFKTERSDGKSDHRSVKKVFVGLGRIASP